MYALGIEMFVERALWVVGDDGERPFGGDVLGQMITAGF